MSNKKTCHIGRFLWKDYSLYYFPHLPAPQQDLSENTQTAFCAKRANKTSSSWICAKTHENTSNAVPVVMSRLVMRVNRATSITIASPSAAYFPVLRQPRAKKSPPMISIVAAIYQSVIARFTKAPSWIPKIPRAIPPTMSITWEPPRNFMVPAVIIITPATTFTKFGQNHVLSPEPVQQAESFIQKAIKNK